MLAAWSGSVEEFVSLLDRNPELASARSGCSHPTLLQFVVLDGGQGKIREPERFMSVLVNRGADLNEPLVAAASIGSQPMASFLLAAGAMIESGAPWTALEESVYWAHSDLSSWLRSRHGAQVRSLRAAAGLGDLEEMDRFFDGDGPDESAGPVRFPWGSLSDEPKDVLDQALVIAAKNGRSLAVKRLLGRGAEPNAFPPGVHEGGSALHVAAMLGHLAVVRLLLEAGANPSQRDPEHGSRPAGWAEHGNQPEVAAFLRKLESP
jgi:ankyrin repeat protein